LGVDLYGGSFTRIIGADVITATPKRITLTLAVSPGPNGQVFASLADISGTGAVWADFAGTIGKAVDSSGTGINGASLKEAIRRGQIVTVHRGSDGTHPTLVVEKVEDPADAGSSLTLDALKDVAAPANTAAGMFLGTTAIGAWGPVANPTAGVWAGKTRTSRPNSTDRLVEVYDGAAWVPIHYDSGIRGVGSLVNAALWTADPTIDAPAMNRVGSTVFFQGAVTSVGAWSGRPVFSAKIPQGFRPAGSRRAFNPQMTSAGTVFAPGAVVYADEFNDVIALRFGAIATGNEDAAGTKVYLMLRYETADPIPTSLPGTLITTAP
jgi:hypothetical protein